MNQELGQEPLIDVSDLKVTIHTYRGDVKAVRGGGVSFSVNAGEIFCIVGESGCGKSTVAQALMKLNPSPPVNIDSGRIIFRGQDLVPASERDMRGIRGRYISMIFQDSMTSLNPTKKIGKQLAESLRIHNKIERSQIREKTVELLKLVGVPSPEERINQYPYELSGGMCQRVMIAMALACEPDLLIADEPTTALDVTIQAQVLELMKSIQRQRGNAIILITHDLGVVAQMADRVAVMYAGEIVEKASCDDLFANPQHPYTKQLLAAKPKLNQSRAQQLTAIDGAPPDLRDDIPGCPFAPRCPWAMERCRHERPATTVSEGGHSARCFLLSDEAEDEQ
ncbi:ABC transporter ATP-binding protein [Bifidobacterium subtile]|jgi:oligopeptide/dipeptide ABC transporter ATP-binding protein|nr:ABC transporter ATP-binding protein [Bifidobacterium subtile]